MSAPSDSANQLRDAVLGFIACIEAEALTPEARLIRLAPALDRLSLAYHESCATEAALGDDEPPSRDYQETRGRMAQLFPTLGYYPLAKGDGDDADLVMGDAIDDLADIFSEVLDVAWMLENSGMNEATSLFRFGFTHHWGRHLCDLRGTVHYELFGM